MKSTEILNIFENFLDNRHTPSEEGVHYGCTCGCGGDYYSRNPECWDEAHDIVYKYRAELKDVLDKLGIEIDTPELMDGYDSEEYF
jgi:hypothetical protein